MKKNRSIEVNIKAAKTAVQEMLRYWHQWKQALNSEDQTQAIAGYVAAYTTCKVYIENYLKQLYPSESKVPMKVTHDIRKLVNDLDMIDKVNDKKLHQALLDIDQLSLDAA